jgi:hypothetical protein
MIKHAYFTVLEADPTQGELVNSYVLLKSFVDDETVDKYVQIYTGWLSKKANPNKKDEMLIKQYLGFTYSLKGEDLRDEINEYIDELLATQEKTV